MKPSSHEDIAQTLLFSIDQGSSTTFVSQPVTFPQNDTRFFSSSTLMDGTHTLDIVNANFEGSDPALWLDLFIITVSQGTSNSSQPSHSSSTSGFQSPSTNSIPAGSTSSLSGPAFTDTPKLANGSTSRTTHTAVVVGSCIGASFFVIIAVVVGCLLQRRRRRAPSGMIYKSPHNVYMSDSCNLADEIRSGIEPFLPIPRGGSLPAVPSSPTQSHITMASTAAGTIHTSVLSPVHPLPNTLSGILRKSQTLARSSSGSALSLPSPLSNTRGVDALRDSVSPSSMGSPSALPSNGLVSEPVILPRDIRQVLSSTPPETLSNAMSLFRAFLLPSRPPVTPSQGGIDGVSSLSAEVDSGLRMYNHAYVPPPEYTTH